MAGYYLLIRLGKNCCSQTVFKICSWQNKHFRRGETKSRKNVKNVYDCLHSRFSRQKDKPTCEQEMNK